MSHAEHRAAAPSHIRCYVITVSDSRTEDTDTGGRLLRELLTERGHQVVGHSIVRDDPTVLRAAIERQLNTPEVQAVITTGGTGISRRDGSYEVIAELLEKRLDGFGEFAIDSISSLWAIQSDYPYRATNLELNDHPRDATG